MYLLTNGSTEMTTFRATIGICKIFAVNCGCFGQVGGEPVNKLLCRNEITEAKMEPYFFSQMEPRRKLLRGIVKRTEILFHLCNRTRINYEGDCSCCQETYEYVGETIRTGYTQVKEYLS